MFLNPRLNALRKSSAQELHFSPKDWELRLHFKPMFVHIEGKILGHQNVLNGLWNPFWQFYWKFPPRVQTSFNSNSKNFLGSHNFLIVLKTFLTKIAALLKLGKHEKRFLGKLRKKGLVFLEINKCSKLFCNESSKTFPSRVYYGFAKTQNAFKIRKSQNDWRSFFQKNGSSFPDGIFNKFWGCRKFRCLPGALFFPRFTTWKEDPPHKWWCHSPKIANSFRF